MDQLIPKDGLVADLVAALTGIPRERLVHWVLVAQYEGGVAVVHTLCCSLHAREGLARVADTPPDIEDVCKLTRRN